MRSYRPGKDQINGLMNANARDQQLRKLAVLQARKKKMLPTRNNSAHVETQMNFSRMSWGLFILLLIIVPGLFFNSRLMRVLMGGANVTDNRLDLLPPSMNKLIRSAIIFNNKDCNIDRLTTHMSGANIEGKSVLGFFRVAVKNTLEFEKHNESSYTQRNINILLEKHDPQLLPYSDVELLNPEKNELLKKYGVSRDYHTKVVLRGDSRSISEILEVGGFHPKFTNLVRIFDINDEPLNVYHHRKVTVERSGFVSTTVDQRIAHHFAYSRTYTIYTLLATGAMAPATKAGLYGDEMEYSVPGGIDKESVVAYRECRGLSSYICSDIYVNGLFAKKNKLFVEDVIRTQLLAGETVGKCSL